MKVKQSKLIKQALFSFFFISFFTVLNAQYIELPLQKKIQNAPFIFEGEVIRSQSFMSEEYKVIFTSHIIKISKIFKGDFRNDEVEIITVGGSVDGLRLDVTNNLTLLDGWEGVFFCKPTIRPSLNHLNSGLALRVYGGEQGFIRYKNDFERTTATTFFDYYDNIETDLLSVIEQKTHKRERVNPNKRERELLAWISQKSYGNSSRNGLKTGIEYEFANPEISGQNNEYFEFDIEVSTFSNTFLFGNSEIYLEYDPIVWGLNLVASGKVTATKETVILSSDYSLIVSDETPSKLKLAINCINNPNNPFSISPNNEELCHLKLDISNLLSVSPNVFFDEISMQGGSEYYQNGNFYDFLNVVAIDSLITSWNSFISPVIDSIRPIFINAGIFDTLYIYGNDFGNMKGEVFFANANKHYGTPLLTKAEDIDVSWSDNLIKVMLFSTNSNRETPSNGHVKIKKAITNDSTTSNDLLIVGFSIRNYRDNITNQSILPVLIDNDNTNSFKFRLHQTITPNSDTADIIRNVLKQWRCKSGVNWELLNQTTNNIILRDYISTIYFTGTNLIIDSTTYALTFSFSFDSTTTTNSCIYNNQKYIYIEEVDMIFNGSNFDWFMTTNSNFTDSTKVDFWTVALHEFGHAHTLGHINLDLPSTMYTFREEDDVSREIDIYSEFGAFWIMDTIELVSPNCGGAIIRNYTGCITSTNEVIEDYRFKIYPNPTNTYVVVEFDNLQNYHNGTLTIYNIYGQKVYQTVESITYGLNTKQIHEISNFNSGLYLVQLTIGDQILSSKLIKF